MTCEELKSALEGAFHVALQPGIEHLIFVDASRFDKADLETLMSGPPFDEDLRVTFVMVANVAHKPVSDSISVVSLPR